uniref:Uncharacterized protein n=1 Tax=Timema tahoe TaxID=61484 RepID=A0A7R9ITV9_9NEOP|nr:unnamed protein product [Timema tahoe]
MKLSFKGKIKLKMIFCCTYITR